MVTTASTVFARIFIGVVCDRFGPRYGEPPGLPLETAAQLWLKQISLRVAVFAPPQPGAQLGLLHLTADVAGRHAAI